MSSMFGRGGPRRRTRSSSDERAKDRRRRSEEEGGSGERGWGARPQLVGADNNDLVGAAVVEMSPPPGARCDLLRLCGHSTRTPTTCLYLPTLLLFFPLLNDKVVRDRRAREAQPARDGSRTNKRQQQHKDEDCVRLSALLLSHHVVVDAEDEDERLLVATTPPPPRVGDGGGDPPPAAAASPLSAADVAAADASATMACTDRCSGPGPGLSYMLAPEVRHTFRRVGVNY